MALAMRSTHIHKIACERPLHGKASAKAKPKFTDELKFERSVLDRLERIYNDRLLSSSNKNQDLLLPIKPTTPGDFYEGKPVKVAYQGARGSYCHEAAVKAFQRCDALPYPGTMDSAFEALESGAADRAVVAVENSLDGVVGRNYDLLLRHQNIHIAGEVLLKVNHCLLGLNGINGVRRVLGHPQALSHCRRRLQSLNATVEAVDFAAEAARLVVERECCDVAVICSGVAARELGLRVLEPAMQDDDDNCTRFLVLAKNLPVASEAAGTTSKTTVAFSVETASLFKAVDIFERRGLRVVKIESRPRREKPMRDGVGGFKYFEYVFVVDLEGSVADPDMQGALFDLEGIAGFVRVMGSYASDL
ncbi:arogenate dehydratase 2 [Cryptomeria japonica]|uniref:arogenate dehydratase 2 n=1 Tax=Cryptomeria japonica TaxID=3369 RepID=UPI0025AB7A44|nr:arogenate dehydratase 2 [Cryptomeria japonica]